VEGTECSDVAHGLVDESALEVADLLLGNAVLASDHGEDYQHAALYRYADEQGIYHGYHSESKSQPHQSEHACNNLVLHHIRVTIFIFKLQSRIDSRKSS